jgi:hypothetical protein
MTMDFNELLHKLEGVRVANRQLVEKLEQAQKECAAYKEFQNVEGNLDSTANKFCVLGNPCRIYTMSFVNDQDTIKGALDVLNVYDGVQFLIEESRQTETVIKMGQITRQHKFPGKLFTTRRNSKGVIVWRID